MKNIGIISFHRAINYGAVLQSYALSECIKKLGCNPIYIDHRNYRIEKVLDYNFSDVFKPRKMISFLINSFIYIKKIKKFDRFISEHLNVDNNLNLNDLISKNKLQKYYSFITGSDQVWNFKSSNFDKAYFLNFVDVSSKKNSYAASFGFENLPNEYIEEYQKLLIDFNHITVREKQGASIIKKILNRDAEIVLDPTLLLSKQDWMKISTSYKNKKDYILIYQLANSKRLVNCAIELSKILNCEVIYIGDSLLKKYNVTYARAVSPETFIGLFINAKYIFTNSFHGIAFSINFNKQFVAECLPNSLNTNSRLDNILTTFDLKDRLLRDNNINQILNSIDYDNVNNILKCERNKSIKLLKMMLGA